MDKAKSKVWYTVKSDVWGAKENEYSWLSRFNASLPPILDRSIRPISPFSLRRAIRFSPESSRSLHGSIVSTRMCLTSSTSLCLTSSTSLFALIPYPPNTSPVLISSSRLEFSAPGSTWKTSSFSSTSWSWLTLSLPATTTNHFLDPFDFRDLNTSCPCLSNSNSFPPLTNFRQMFTGARCPRLVFITEQKSESVRILRSLLRSVELPAIKKVTGRPSVLK